LRAGVRKEISSFAVRSPMQRKYAAEAAHVARGGLDFS